MPDGLAKRRAGVVVLNEDSGVHWGIYLAAVTLEGGTGAPQEPDSPQN